MFKEQSVTSGSHNWTETLDFMLDQGICIWIDRGARNGSKSQY